MRQFVLTSEPAADGTILICGQDFRYLRQVLRVKPGYMLSVRLPDGELRSTTVVKVDENARQIILQICETPGKSVTRGVQASEIWGGAADAFCCEYTLFQFIPKPVKLEQIVRQATECGVRTIVPVIGEYSERSSVQALLGAKKERLERIVKEARQQSGSPVATQVLSPVSLQKALLLWQNTAEERPPSVGFVLSERAGDEVSPRDILLEKKPERICIAVGCEGGISPQELEILKKSLFYSVHFSVNILRCETAAVYGIAAIQTAV